MNEDLYLEDYLPNKNKNHFLNRPKIGIIAGMGPSSTAPFIDRITHYFQKYLGYVNDDDYPYIEIISLPTPFRINKIIDKDITLFDLKYAIEALNNHGMNFIAIPCNSVHYCYNEYLNFSKIPILNIVDEFILFLKENFQGRNVSILATETTISSNIYQEKIQENNFKIVLDENIQKKFNSILKLIKNNFENKNTLISIISRCSEI